jgi:hypothetical protein
MSRITIHNPLVREEDASVGYYGSMELTGDMEEDIERICHRLTSDIREEYAQFVAGITESFPTFLEFGIKAQRISTPKVDIIFFAKRTESPAELSIRVAKEEKIRLKKELITSKKKTEAIDMIRKLAKLHNLPLVIVQPGGVPANEADAGNQGRS